MDRFDEWFQKRLVLYGQHSGAVVMSTETLKTKINAFCHRRQAFEEIEERRRLNLSDQIARLGVRWKLNLDQFIRSIGKTSPRFNEKRLARGRTDEQHGFFRDDGQSETDERTNEDVRRR